MGAVPKERISKGRKNRRRSQDRLKKIQTIVCTNCGEQKLPHKVCAHCGYYKGRKVL